MELKEFHKKMAVELFNSTWDLIDKKERTQEDIDNMIHMAHASRYHWGQIGEPINLVRGEWQISRVYSILKMGESALYHANRSLELCVENNIGDFDLAFAYEAIARAYKVLGNEEKKIEYIQKALEAANNIKNEDDKKYTISEINNIG
ncbi:hypothetical protein [Marinitoga litoralis]|jgi:tetratricopeptide (TPR) repeat protein|uniref:hypothetical protein n=1 Tax=Marinitoga litoralis TaxID=570855 RepID=UPI0019618996|nr:hypothetical protein [Marinitoga litoralis]MBM7560207.1 tetratricopeptide (TPR) repeat protein [Marinitoga litoralis]